MKYALAIILVALTVSSCHADSLGTVTAAVSVPCTVVNGWTGTPDKLCWELTVSVPGLADQTAVLGMNLPAVLPPLGTVVFMIGGGAPGPYDSALVDGYDVVEGIIAAGYQTVQVFFPFAPAGTGSNQGWITTNQGIRAAAARPATAVNWIVQNLAYPDTPLCHVGNSGGSSAGAFLLGDFAIPYTFVELGAGPTYTAIDKGCGVTTAMMDTPCGEGTQPMTWVPNTQINDGDPAYGASKACSKHLGTALVKFQSDSILRSDTVLDFPATGINVVLGGRDLSAAVAQAAAWINALHSARFITTTCCPDCQHDITATPSGVAQLIFDVTTFCTVPGPGHKDAAKKGGS